MSNSDHEPGLGIDDEQLPEDLQPSEDNPLAEGLEDRETAGDLLEEGKGPERSPDQDEDEGEEAEKDRGRDKHEGPDEE
jgi:hypothetical protein